MIKNDPGSAKIHQLWVIHLYEYDLNLLLDWFVQEMDQHCEGKYLLNKWSYGWRPGRRSINPIIVDVTQLKIAMIIQQILVRFNNNATACFDWIMPHILCLRSRSYQMPVKCTALIRNLLQYAKYAIKTANGASKETYSHSTQLPVFGSGQGSTVSATGWGKLVSKILGMYDKQRFGSHYSDLEELLKTIIGMLGFVDNNNISNIGANMNQLKMSLNKLNTMRSYGMIFWKLQEVRLIYSNVSFRSFSLFFHKQEH